MVLMNASGLPIPPQAVNKAEATQSSSAEYILSISEQEFMTEVIEFSMNTPVLVDFWAPWCEPCKQYTPVLEKAIHAEKGRVRLVKVNIDENQGIAAQLQIRSLPTVMVFLQGRPVESIPGVLPADTLKKLLSDLLKMTGAGSSAEEFQAAIEQAEAALATKDYDEAVQAFEGAMAIDPESPVAAAGIIRALIGLGDSAGTQEFYDSLLEDLQNSAEVTEAMQGLKLLGSGDDQAVQAALNLCAEKPEDLSAIFALAEAYLEANRKDNAVDSLLSIIAKDREWQNKQAQQKLLEIFAALGFQDPLAKSGRQRLSALLFS